MKYISFLFLALLLTFVVIEGEGDKVGHSTTNFLLFKRVLGHFELK